jgi:hypothetical protein
LRFGPAEDGILGTTQLVSLNRVACSLALLPTGRGIPFASVRAAGGSGEFLAVRFEGDRGTRRALIRKLFTGGYNNEVERVSILRTLVGVTRKVFS